MYVCVFVCVCLHVRVSLDGDSSSVSSLNQKPQNLVVHNSALKLDGVRTYSQRT